MKKPELLAPAGNMGSLKAAISAGCDAVYLGGKLFGARSYASNFSNDEMIEAIKYAHIYGVKIYVTVNTLIFENEIEEFMKYIDFLHKNNVDAIIIQDLGMLDLISQTYPNLEIHASTQMNIHNIEGISLVEKLGVKRVVLSRETRIEEIEKIKKKSNMDLEIFIHGALCVSYSGQCLMSYFQGGRSGNRGNCAQCCRMPYNLLENGKIVNNEKYVLSTKDLCTIENIGKLIDIEVDSLKIEGRMKRPEYVYIVTKLYRMAIDNYIENKKTNISKKDFDSLLKIFNRKFTKGFLFNEENNNLSNPYRPNHMGTLLGKVINKSKDFITIKLKDELNQEDGIRILNKDKDIGCIVNRIYKNNKLVNHALKNEIVSIQIQGNVDKSDKVIKTTDKKEMEQIKQELLKNDRKIDINIKIKCLIHKNLEIQISDGKNNIKLKSEYICQKAETQPITKEKIKKQIDRLVNTAYKIQKLEIEIDDLVFVSIKEINKLRRDAISILNEKRCYKIPYEKKEYKREIIKRKNESQISVMINNEKYLEKVKGLKLKSIYTKNNYNDTILKLPRVINKFKKLDKKLLIEELGSLYYYSNFITDFSFNVTNSYTVALLNYLGSKRITLSYENTDQNIEKMVLNYEKRYNQKPNLEVIISSYPEVMISKFNLLKKYNLKNICYLQNQKGQQFKIEENDNLMTVYHSEKIKKDNYKKYLDLNLTMRIEINDEEDFKFLKNIIKKYNIVIK